MHRRRRRRHAAFRALFRRQVEHLRWSGRLPRTVYDLLSIINLTDAMVRDNLGRLRRRSWLHTKLMLYQRPHLELFAAYRNLSRQDLRAWRRDWGLRAIHPASRDGCGTCGQAV